MAIAGINVFTDYDNVIKRPSARKCLNLLRPLSVEAGVNLDFVVFIVFIVMAN
jgi:hypothetical protein